MSKKSMVIAGVIVAVAVAVVAGALFMYRGGSPKVNSNAGTASSDASGSASGAASSNASGAASGTGATGTGATQGQTSGTNSTTQGGTSSSKPTAGGNGAVPTVALKPFPTMPDPGIPAETLTSPQTAGKSLAPLTTAPDPTISALANNDVPEGAQYTVRIRPYGIGPSTVFGSRIVIRVDSAKPIGTAPANDKIVNANIIVLADTTNGGAITKGGTYTATLTFRSDGSMMLPIVSKVAAAQ